MVGLSARFGIQGAAMWVPGALPGRSSLRISDVLSRRVSSLEAGEVSDESTSLSTSGTLPSHVAAATPRIAKTCGCRLQSLLRYRRAVA